MGQKCLVYLKGKKSVMSKLWDKGNKLNPEIEDFSVGEDYLLDQNLAEADILVNIAYAKMLESIGLLTKADFGKLQKSLKTLYFLNQEGKFKIKKRQEDIHTAVENYLVEKTKSLGEKLHVGKSRNDQVIADLRLYAKDKLLEAGEQVLALSKSLVKFARKHKALPMVGYTHSRKAMPSSVGLWAASFLESLLDDILLLEQAYSLNNQCPLGSAASYGTSLPIERDFLAKLLGFGKVQNNVLYVNNSRGKIESIIIFALSEVMLDLAKLAEDLILFTREEFVYFKLPPDICTGSSIMPQKSNPDVLELIRAKYVEVQAKLFQTLNTLKGLPSGYNRDLQLTKAPLINSFTITVSSLTVMSLVVDKLGVNKVNLEKAFSGEVFAADEATKLACQGTPFREAYQEVAKNLPKLKSTDPYKNIKEKKYLGAPGNLGLEKAEEKIKETQNKILQEKQKLQKIKDKLLTSP